MATKTNVIVRDGTDDPISFELLLNDSFLPLGSATDIEMKIRGKDGALVSHKITDPSPLLAVEDAANGRVKFSRTKTTFIPANSPYKVHFIVTDTGKDSSYPEEYEVTVSSRPS